MKHKLFSGEVQSAFEGFSISARTLLVFPLEARSENNKLADSQNTDRNILQTVSMFLICSSPHALMLISHVT